jgi:hypothetical protein
MNGVVLLGKSSYQTNKKEQATYIDIDSAQRVEEYFC